MALTAPRRIALAPFPRPTHWIGLGRVFPPLLVLLVLVTFWQLVSTLVLSRGAAFLLPPPAGVLRETVFDGQHRSELLSGVRNTATVALAGFLIASVVGLAIAIVMHQSRWLHRAVYPYLVIVDTIPTLALVPLIGFSFGYGFRSQVLVCVLVGLFPMVNNATLGFRSIDHAMTDLFRLHRCNRMVRLRLLDLPAALPEIATGLKISAPLAVIAAVVSDFFFRSGEPGIGRLIFLYRRNLSSELLIGAVIAAALLGLTFLAAVNLALALVLRGRTGKTLIDRRPSTPTHPDDETNGAQHVQANPPRPLRTALGGRARDRSLRRR